jgi:RTX calcium-binding nonapeptide repeat (4 copies)
MHPHLNHALASDRIRELTEHAARARLAGRRPRARRALLAAVLPVALVAAALPAAAQAATVELASDGTLNYRAAAGEINSLNVRAEGAAVEIKDFAGLTSRTTLCAQITSGTVRCAIGVELGDVRLGDRNDLASIRVSGRAVVDGGSGDDSYFGGASPLGSRVEFRGGDGFDVASYSGAVGQGVRLVNDGVANDGRPALDQDNVHGDVERLTGSRFADDITGMGGSQICCAQVVSGGQGVDTLRDGPGPVNTVFDMGPVADGADNLIGGSGRSLVDYSERTQPVNVTLNFGGADDGEPGERDEITGSNEGVFGGQAGDALRAPAGSAAAHTIRGRAGNDTIEGADGADDLFGDGGEDTIIANGGADLIRANDGFGDTVGCGQGSDTAELDSRDGFDASCENRQVGILRLAPKALRAKAGDVARLRLSWRHPHSWRQLRRVELRLVHADVPVATVTIRPRGQRLTAEGAVKLVRRVSRIARNGKSVGARFALRLNRSLAGRRLRVEVEAVDVRGARQLKSNAGSIRIAN